MNTKMTDKQDDLEDELQAILNLSEKLIMQQKIDVDKNWRLLHSRIHKTNQRQMFFKWIRNIAAISTTRSFLLFLLSDDFIEIAA